VVVPATPADGYSLLRQSIELDDPVIFLEPKRRYWAKQELQLPVTTEPIGQARVLREGTDCSVAAYGPMVKVALDAAQAAEEEGLGELEVIDLRSIVPLDEDTLVASARKTGRMVVVHEAPEFLGPGAEVAARVTEAAFLHLEGGAGATLRRPGHPLSTGQAGRGPPAQRGPHPLDRPADVRLLSWLRARPP
jgi:2-oxoisovalerate dehydrogenase E1 component beta subunit